MLDLGGFGNGDALFVFFCLRVKFFFKDVFAKDNAVVANVNARSGDEFSDFRVRFAAEAA
jgi:hypothetical protein